MYMLSNREWREKVGFVPSPAARAGATPWGVATATKFNGLLKNSLLQDLLPLQDPGLLPGEAVKIFLPFGEQAPRLIKSLTREVNGPDGDFILDVLYTYMYKTSRGEHIQIPSRRWRTCLEVARYLKDPPPETFYELPTSGSAEVLYLNTSSLLKEYGFKFSNCAYSYADHVRRGVNRIVILEDRIMVRYNPYGTLLEAKYRFNEEVSPQDLLLVKSLLNLS